MLTNDVVASARRTESIGVPKALVSVATVPLTGSRLLPANRGPMVSPSAASALVTCATSAALGP